MDELELVKRFYGEPAAADDAARARARARLVSVQARRPRPRRVWFAAAVVAAVVMAGIAVSLGSSSGADGELHRLAGVAAEHDLAAGSRPVVYERTESLEPDSFEDLSGGGTFVVEVRRQTEIWRSPDGAIMQIRTVLALSFGTEEDRASWGAAKETGLPVPEVGEVVRDHVPPGEIRFPDLSELPLDAEQLIDWLRERSTEPLDDHDEMLAAIAELLARGDASPRLRQALFEAATTLDGVQLLGSRIDPLGRQGVAVGAGDVVIVVDPETSFVLSIEERFGSISSWRAYTAWATVDAPGDRPGDELS